MWPTINIRKKSIIMIIALTFFFGNLKQYQILLFGVFLSLHISSHVWYLEADKYLTKIIPKILANPDDTAFSKELYIILFQNIGYLIMYALTMLIIEAIGKLAVKNAIIEISKKLLEADLSEISKKEYEHQMTSVIHHGDNVSSAIRNLFIEFPRKIIACCHFLLALHELSVEIMIYCTLANILFVSVSLVISFARKIFFSKIVDTNINFSVYCSG